MTYYSKNLDGSDLVAPKVCENKLSIQIGKDLYLNDKMADVYFLFHTNDGDIRVPAHKLLLAVGSAAFATMFFGELRERGDIKIVDASVDGFKEFLQFFYLRELSLTLENIVEVMNLAHKYLVTMCYEVCDEFLKQFPVEIVCFTYELALFYSRTELVEFCEQEIRKYAKEVLESDSFEICSKGVLERILKMDYLHCDEIQVFHACVKWSKKALLIKQLAYENNQSPPEDTPRKMLGNLFHLIQFGVMSKSTVHQCVTSHGSFFIKEEMLDLFDLIMAVNNDLVRLRTFTRRTRKNACDIEYITPNFGHELSSNESSHNSGNESVFTSKHLMQQEITQFYTNIQVILVAVETNYINVGDHPNDLSAVLSVVGSHGVIIEQNINFWKNKYPNRVEIQNYTKLSQRIKIDPYQLYEIRIKFTSIGRRPDENGVNVEQTPLEVSNPVDTTGQFELKTKGGIIYKFHFNKVPSINLRTENKIL